MIVRQMRAFSTAVILTALLMAAGAPAEGQTASAPADAGAGYYFLLGRHLESARKIDEAIAAHTKAAELAPASAEVRAELAGLYARQDRVGEALDTAEAAIRIDPANREANRIVGSILAALAEQRQPLRPGDDTSQYRPRAIAALEKSRREVGIDLNLELMLGRLYLQAGRYEQSIFSLRRIVDDQPGYPEAAMLMAEAQNGAGRSDEAIGTLEKSLKENPGFFRGHVRLAELYDEERRFDDAAASYARAQTANPRVDLAERSAASLINAGKSAEARDLVQASLNRKTTPDAGLLYLLAQAQRQLKDTQGAAATAQRLKTAFPEDPRVLYLDAQLLGDAGRKAEAIAAFQTLIARSPDDASLVYQYANLLEKGGRLADAERALRDLLARDPLDANALNSLGYLFAERGERLDEAVDLVQRALKVEPANASFLDSLGWAYYQQGKLDQADPPLSEAAAKLPRSSAVQDHLGDLRFKQQRFADALSAWERALAGDGDSIDRAKVEQKMRDARARVRR
jgi:tetratricopeptide (TPR) repeat protein